MMMKKRITRPTTTTIIMMITIITIAIAITITTTIVRTIPVRRERRNQWRMFE